MKGKIFVAALLLLFFLPLALAEETVDGANDTASKPTLLDDGVGEGATNVTSTDGALIEEAPVNVSADTEVVGEELVKATGGTGPDSPFYGLDVWLDDVKMFFTSDPEARAELALNIAEERMLEAQTMALKGKVEHYKLALREHKRQMAAAEEAVDGMAIDGDEERARLAWKTSLRLKNKIEDQELKNEVMRARIKAKVKELSDEERAALLAEMEAAAAELEKAGAQVKLKANNARISIRAKTGKTEEELSTEEDALEEEIGLKKARKERIKTKVRIAKKALEDAVKEADIETAEDVEAKVADTEAVLDELEDENGTEDTEEYEAVTETLEAYKNFGKRIREIAKQVKTGEKTREDLREAARSIHIKVLERIREKVGEQARERIEANIERSREKIEQLKTRVKGRVREITPDENATEGEDGEGTETEGETEDSEETPVEDTSSE